MTDRVTTLIERKLPVMIWWEMRSLMRGNRAPVLLLICTAVAVGVEIAFLYFSLPPGGLDREAFARVGRELFLSLLGLEILLILLLMPLLTAGTVIQERLQHTMDDLLLTCLDGREIASGKMLAAFGYVVVVLVCLLPVHAIVFMLGGVSPWELLVSHAVLVGFAGFLGAFGVYCSSVMCNLFTAQIVALLCGLVGFVSQPLLALAPKLVIFVRELRDHRNNIAFNTCMMLMLCFVLAMLGVFAIPIILVAISIPNPFFTFLMLIGGISWGEFWWQVGLLSSLISIGLGRYFLSAAGVEIRRPRVATFNMPDQWIIKDIRREERRDSVKR